MDTPKMSFYSQVGRATTSDNVDFSSVDVNPKSLLVLWLSMGLSHLVLGGSCPAPF